MKFKKNCIIGSKKKTLSSIGKNVEYFTVSDGERLTIEYSFDVLQNVERKQIVVYN